MSNRAELRRSSILSDLLQHQAISVSALSERYGVSEVSIRRDLAHLERAGRLRRIHGGALVSGESDHWREGTPAPDAAMEAKIRIGRAAAALVKPGERLIFDSGTTALQVARCLPPDLRETGNLTAITNSLPIVDELGAAPGIQLILLGGLYLPQYQVLVGPNAVADVERLHADKMFLGADGLTLSHGVTNANVLEAEVDRAAIGAASEVIIVSDSSKIGQIGLVTLVPLAGVHRLITDADAPEGFVAQVRALGVEVTLV